MHPLPLSHFTFAHCVILPPPLPPTVPLLPSMTWPCNPASILFIENARLGSDQTRRLFLEAAAGPGPTERERVAAGDGERQQLRQPLRSRHVESVIGGDDSATLRDSVGSGGGGRPMAASPRVPAAPAGPVLARSWRVTPLGLKPRRAAQWLLGMATAVLC